MNTAKILAIIDRTIAEVEQSFDRGLEELESRMPPDIGDPRWPEVRANVLAEFLAHRAIVVGGLKAAREIEAAIAESGHK